MKLNAIARQTGVGQGTLYRHFPIRDDLLAEVYRDDVGELVAAAPGLLAAHKPLTALARWLDRVADYAQVKRGVFAAVEAGVSAVASAVGFSASWRSAESVQRGNSAARDQRFQRSVECRTGSIACSCQLGRPGR